VGRRQQSGRHQTGDERLRGRIVDQDIAPNTTMNAISTTIVNW
jgi:hypothetical protein